MDDHFVLTCHAQYIGNESAPVISWNGPGSNTSSCVIVGLNATMFLRATTIGAFFSCFVRLESPDTDGDDNLVSTYNCKSAVLNQTGSYSSFCGIANIGPTGNIRIVDIQRRLNAVMSRAY